MSNPYQPPQSPSHWATEESSRYTFEGNVTLDHIDAAMHRPVRFVILSVPFCLAALLTGLATWGSYRNSPQSLSWLLPLALTFFEIGILGRLAWVMMGPIGRRIAKSTPQVVGDMRGSISSSSIEIVSEHGKMEYPLDSICMLNRRNNVLCLAFDQRHLMRYFIPASAFEAGGFEGAWHLLSAKVNSNLQNISLIDARLTAPDAVLSIEAPSDAIVFEGAVRLSDFTQSALSKLVWRERVKAILWIVGLNLAVIAFIVWATTLRLKLTPLLIAFVVFYNLWVLTRLYRGMGVGRKPDTVVLCLRGAMNKNGIWTANAIGRSYSRWSAFNDVLQSDKVMSLSLPGRLKRHVILNRDMFQSDDDWVAANALARQQISN